TRLDSCVRADPLLAARSASSSWRWITGGSISKDRQPVWARVLRGRGARLGGPVGHLLPVFVSSAPVWSGDRRAAAGGSTHPLHPRPGAPYRAQLLRRSPHYRRCVRQIHAARPWQYSPRTTASGVGSRENGPAAGIIERACA